MRRGSFVVLFLLGALLLSPSTSLAQTAACTFVTPSATQSITGPDGVCRKITNPSSTNNLCVLTYSVAVWQNFYGNPGAATLASCSAVVPGSQSFTTAGTYTFTVPAYNTLTVKVWGGGGGGGDTWYGNNGGTGGTSTFAAATGTLTANGGGGGQSGVNGTAGGAGGSASGGTVNTTGGSGGSGAYVSGSFGNFTMRSGPGGNAPNGGTGGAARVAAPYDGGPGNPGGPPAGGGSGGIANGNGFDDMAIGAGGGSGGYASTTWTSGQLAVGATISVTVGAAGAGGPSSWGDEGGNGAPGSVTIEWN